PRPRATSTARYCRSTTAGQQFDHWVDHVGKDGRLHPVVEERIPTTGTPKPDPGHHTGVGLLWGTTSAVVGGPAHRRAAQEPDGTRRTTVPRAGRVCSPVLDRPVS